MLQRVTFALICLATSALSEPPEIVGVQVHGKSVSVTLAHPDTGWDHYADGWRIEDVDGKVIGTRVLLHPHVTEQPFTRSLTLPGLPDGAMFLRARCSVHGWSDEAVRIGG